MRPAVPFIPIRPQKPAGMRIAAAVAAGGDGQEAAGHGGGRSARRASGRPPGCHGLWVTPLSLVKVTLRPPNSLAVVCPTLTTPAPPGGGDRGGVVGHAIGEHQAPFGRGQPSTGSSSLTPMGTPPSGCETSACGGGRPGRLRVDMAQRVERAALDRVEDQLDLLLGGALTRPKGVDQGAGISLPGGVCHGLAVWHLQSLGWTPASGSDSNRRTTPCAGSCRSPDLLDLSSGASLAILGDYVPFGISQALGLAGGGNSSLDNTLRQAYRNLSSRSRGFDSLPVKASQPAGSEPCMGVGNDVREA